MPESCASRARRRDAPPDQAAMERGAAEKAAAADEGRPRPGGGEDG